jgi:Cdc6-like AAA superfamily ATPase
MRTRSRKHEWVEEARRLALAASPASLESRKHAREEGERGAEPVGASPRRCAAPTEAVELLSPPLKRMRPFSSVDKSPVLSTKVVKVVVSDSDERFVPRRTLQYEDTAVAPPPGTKPKQQTQSHDDGNDEVDETSTPLIAAEALNDGSVAVLQRICAGQWLQHTGGVVGREQQKREVRAVLDGTTDDGRNCLFLVGPPGTGKTSCVDELLAEYEVHALSAVRINCSTFANPSALYADIVRRLGDSRGKQKGSTASLPEVFSALALDSFLCRATTDIGSTKRSANVVLVLDEVDHLLRLPKRQQVRVAQILRFLVQWSTLSSSLKFLGIMNGIDMYAQITRLLGTAGQSAADIPHIVFGSYSHEELVDILNHYAGSAAASAAAVSTVDARALELIARKVAARDGDARRAISLLQQCARSALHRTTARSSTTPFAPKDQPAAQINLRDVIQSSSDMLSTPLAKQIAQLPRLPKLLLYVLTTLAPSNESVMSGLNAVSEELARLSARSNAAWLPRFSREELVRHVATLECYALLKRDPRRRAATPGSKSFWSAKLASAATMDDVTRALRGDDVLSQALQFSA